METSAPALGDFETAAAPPCAIATAATMASPRPAPPLLLLSSARVKRSKACGTKSGGKPLPSSVTCQHERVVVLDRREADSALPVPEGVFDEVSERLLDSEAIDLGAAGPPGDLDRSSGRLGPSFEAGGATDEKLADLDVVSADGEGAFVEPPRLVYA